MFLNAGELSSFNNVVNSLEEVIVKFTLWSQNIWLLKLYKDCAKDNGFEIYKKSFLIPRVES